MQHLNLRSLLLCTTACMEKFQVSCGCERQLCFVSRFSVFMLSESIKHNSFLTKSESQSFLGWGRLQHFVLYYYLATTGLPMPRRGEVVLLKPWSRVQARTGRGPRASTKEPRDAEAGKMIL